jgi:hypothetical protein
MTSEIVPRLLVSHLLNGEKSDVSKGDLIPGLIELSDPIILKAPAYLPNPNFLDDDLDSVFESMELSSLIVPPFL